MKNNYKTRAMLLLFSIITIINVIMLTMVYFSYSSSIKDDYEEKLSSVASQASANANLILSLFEEEIEIFINKYSIEKDLESFKIDAPNFVRTESISFEQIVIFNGTEPCYISSAEHVDFYRDMVTGARFAQTMKGRDRGWFIRDGRGESLNQHGPLFYARTLFDNETKEEIGYIVAAVATNQLLNLIEGHNDDQKGDFLPDDIGISIDGEMFFPRENVSRNEKRIFSSEDLHVRKNEVCFVNTYNGKDFYTIHNTKALRNKTLTVLYLFLAFFAVITVVSYKILTFLINEICDRIDKLNDKIERYSPAKEEKIL